MPSPESSEEKCSGFIANNAAFGYSRNVADNGLTTSNHIEICFFLYDKFIVERNDRDIIDAGFKSMVSFGNDELVPHFIYCGEYLYVENMNFRKLFMEKMRKFGIQSSILTMLSMHRRNLITQEKANEASDGKLMHEWDKEFMSINDDLEMFFTNLLNSKEVKKEKVHSFFTPKLTKEELKLVQMKNEDHLETYLFHSAGFNPDVNVKEMGKSDSKSKYVHGECVRKTYSLTLDNE